MEKQHLKQQDICIKLQEQITKEVPKLISKSNEKLTEKLEKMKKEINGQNQIWKNESNIKN